jgi:lysophospholipase L1-like esterase
VDIPTQSSASHTVSVEVTVAGLAGVVIMGCDLKILGGNGVRVHKLGNGGAAAVQYEAATAAIWQAGLAELAPNLVILLLGTNDHSAEIDPDDFEDQITTIVDRIRAARANTDILLLSPTGNGLSKAYELSDYVLKLRNVAVAESTAMLDAYLLMPSYTVGNSRGLYANTTHLNASGGQYVADALLRLLKAY